MPQPSLNNVAVQATYVDALTVEFVRGRPAFSLSVFNGAVFYTLAYLDKDARQVVWMPDEHQIAPSLSQFDDPAAEGLPQGTTFGGIKLRSAVVPVPTVAARVIVS